ncbi:hypothetical protein FACS189485_12930 [Spirochaetia bacterium]|nr:hypothetical protein FACS189485_12930 [Spirochaetia bacterium]
MTSKEILAKRFAAEKPLKEIAQGRSLKEELDPHHPGGRGYSLFSGTRLSSRTTRVSLWGTAENITFSLLKTDVIDRRYIDREQVTMADVIEGAYSEANKDLNDMPMAGMTRPSFSILDKRGGRYNYGLWSEAYPFPCQKPVGQVIIKAPDFADAAQPVAEQCMGNAEVTASVEKDGKRLDVGYVLAMEKNIMALKLDYKNLTKPLALRLYRNLDQGHRRYTNEDGTYKKFIQYQPADSNEPIQYYDFAADKDKNGCFEPPTYGNDGRFFWVHQIFPAEPTFPEGFRYVMMGLVSGAEADISEHGLQKDLGTKPVILRDNQGMLMVPGFRTTVHPEIIELQALNYSYVAAAPGVAVDAVLKNPQTGQAVVYIAVVTCNETPDYMEKAKQLLLDAEKQGYEKLREENQKWYDALYEKRENGRILLGEGGGKTAAGDFFFDEIFQSWTSGHMGSCFPDPRKLEGSASYAAFDVDTQNWHSLPCYNELFTEGTFFMRNRYEPKLQWPWLVSHWHETFKEKARVKFGLPGMMIAHGYLPAAKQSPWYCENGVLDFTMEVPGQILKVIWNFWDYTGDEAFLKETCYPLLKDLAVFYEAFARRGWDGKVFNLEPTVETESYGISYRMEYTRNNTGAIAMFRCILRLAAEAAAYLNTDADLIPGWLEVAGKLAPYPKFYVEGGEVLGADEKAFPRFTRGDHYMYSGFYPVTLADEINLDSPPHDKELIARTADIIGYGRSADAYLLVGKARDFVPRHYAYGHRRIAEGDYATLASEISGVPERLMNSRSRRIHLFPAVPDWTVASFRNFLARGGFEVSASRTAKGVEALTIKARRAIPCHVMNPWPGSAVTVTDTTAAKAVNAEIDRSNGECIVFDAEAGHEYSFDK